MRTVALFLALVAGPLVAAAQDTPNPGAPIVASAEVSGLPIDQLSPGLQHDIEALVGDRFDRDRVAALAARIEGEHPDIVAAARDVALADGRVRVVLLCARISDDTDLASNINARYFVDRVEITGIDESEISQALRDDLQKLVGARFDADEADRLRKRLAEEQPDYEVSRRISRGSQSGGVRVVFAFSESEARRWIHFPPSRSKFVYHEDEGGSGVLDLNGDWDNVQVSLGFAWGNDDDLVEEYSGFWFRVGNRELGTKRIGASLEVARYEPEWQPGQLSFISASPAIPPPYRTRLTLLPEVTFALNRHVRFTGGASVSELDALDPLLPDQRSNAGTVSVGYDQTWRPDRRSSHRLEASYRLHAGTSALDSDFLFKSHVGQVRYEYEHRDSMFIASVSLGRITGQAPIFERYTLGDTTTLRGWNKYEIAPAGAERMVHSSIEFRFHGFAYFFDAGSLWDPGVDAEALYSTGFGFHGEHAFLTIAFPLNAADVDATFMAGVRF